MNNENPRFCYCWPCVHEQFPDVPEPSADGSIMLWDRQEKKPVATIPPEYAQAVVLESATMPDNSPFTYLEKWFNELSNNALESEGMVTTKVPYTSNGVVDDPDSVAALRCRIAVLDRELRRLRASMVDLEENGVRVDQPVHEQLRAWSKTEVYKLDQILNNPDTLPENLHGLIEDMSQRLEGTAKELRAIHELL